MEMKFFYLLFRVLDLFLESFKNTLLIISLEETKGKENKFSHQKHYHLHFNDP